jgi:hypothetical protein
MIESSKPGDLSVQQPDKYTLVINLKTAKALGLDLPPVRLARADEMMRQQALARRGSRARRSYQPYEHHGCPTAPSSNEGLVAANLRRIPSQSRPRRSGICLKRRFRKEKNLKLGKMTKPGHLAEISTRQCFCRDVFTAKTLS